MAGINLERNHDPGLVSTEDTNNSSKLAKQTQQMHPQPQQATMTRPTSAKVNYLKELPIYYTPTERDVICAKGKWAAMQHENHPGNVVFRELVRKNIEAYKNSACKLDRSNLVTEIEAEMQKRGALFVRKHNGRWAKICSKNAREKISANFRDLLPSMYLSSAKVRAKARAADRFIKRHGFPKPSSESQPSSGSTESQASGSGSESESAKEDINIRGEGAAAELAKKTAQEQEEEEAKKKTQEEATKKSQQQQLQQNQQQHLQQQHLQQHHHQQQQQQHQYQHHRQQQQQLQQQQLQRQQLQQQQYQQQHLHWHQRHLQHLHHHLQRQGNRDGLKLLSLEAESPDPTPGPSINPWGQFKDKCPHPTPGLSINTWVQFKDRPNLNSQPLFVDPQGKRINNKQEKDAAPFRGGLGGRGGGRAIPSTCHGDDNVKGRGRGRELIPAPARGIPLNSTSVFNLLDLNLKKAEWAATKSLLERLVESTPAEAEWAAAKALRERLADSTPAAAVGGTAA